MKYKNILSILLLFTLVLGLASCSKDKKIENLLTKKDGVWNIDEVQWVTTEQTFNPVSQIVLVGTTYDAGTFTFEKDGDGSYDYTIGSTKRTGTFNYSVENEELTVVYVKQTIYPFSQEATAYSGEKTGKKSFYVEGTETHQDIDGQYVFAGKFYLSR